jgi:hypothetical protein
MSRSARMRRVGGLAVSAVAAAPFVYLWVTMMRDADDPLTFRARLDMAIWIAAFGAPWMIAAQLLWRAWWRQAGARLSELGTNLGDAIWWTLPVLVLWALPLGMLGAAAGRRPIPTASGSTGSGRR